MARPNKIADFRFISREAFVQTGGNVKREETPAGRIARPSGGRFSLGFLS
jgi:hypothetical protein